MTITIGGYCMDCAHESDGFCDYVERDDDDYPHSNSVGAGIEVVALDDSGLSVRLRVEADFGCVKYKARAA